MPQFTAVERSFMVLTYSKNRNTSNVIAEFGVKFQNMFPNRIIGLGYDIEYPLRSPDLTACDFFLWSWIRTQVYAESLVFLSFVFTRLEIRLSTFSTKILIPSPNCRKSVLTQDTRVSFLCSRRTARLAASPQVYNMGTSAAGRGTLTDSPSPSHKKCMLYAPRFCWAGVSSKVPRRRRNKYYNEAL